VLRGSQSLAMDHLVRLEMAVQPGLTVRVDQHAFRVILQELVRTAIEQSPCGCVLLTATRVGCRVHASVSDDGPEADGASRLARLRHAEGIVALQGGSMEINARAGEGTTVTVRLPGGGNPDPGDPADLRTESGKSPADNIAR
jgi:signal transduction histidine kinase